jgi:hypothetical protein
MSSRKLQNIKLKAYRLSLGTLKPKRPTAVVMPALVNLLKGTGGTRVEKPASPPPPVKWVLLICT